MKDTNKGPPCRLCGRKLSRIESEVCITVDVCASRVAGLPSPFDPNPRALEPATNGFIWCDKCESAQPVSGHECAKPGERPLGALVSLTLELEYAQAEAEAAHSLLCALALDHGLERFRRHFGGVEGYCHGAEECVFCGAARGGGR